MIVDCAVYRDGRRVAGAVDDLSDALADVRARNARRNGGSAAGATTVGEAVVADGRGGDGFVWIGLCEPTQEELAHVVAEFDLHPLAVEDAVNAHQRPKMERYEGSLFVVLKTLWYVDETADIESGEVMLFLGDAFVVTVRHGEGNPLKVVRQRLETDPHLLEGGPAAVLYAVADAVVDRYTDIAREVEQDLEELESAVFSGRRENYAERIYALKREVLEFRRAAVPLLGPAQDLAEGDVPEVGNHTREFFRDVSDHVMRVVEQVESADRLLTDILNANLAQVSVRQNDDMRRISAWVAIVAVPTMVAGIYGMNFEHMPELELEYGYPMTLGGMLIACVVLYRLFKRSGWL
ncbi:MAG: magnesium/cobalt transporter CorA [Actinomycetes bacterium]